MRAIVRMRPVRGFEPFDGAPGELTGGSATATEDVGVQQSMLVPASGGKFDGDVTGGFLAERNLHAINPIDGWVAGRGAAKDLHIRSRKKAQVGQVVADLFGKFQRLENCGLSYSEIAEGHGTTSPDRYTTGAVVV